VGSKRNSARVATNPNARIYPCERCGTMRSEAEGGTTFTVCDECWDILAAEDRKRRGAKTCKCCGQVIPNT
jgi:hypothetical protein